MNFPAVQECDIVLTSGYHNYGGGEMDVVRPSSHLSVSLGGRGSSNMKPVFRMLPRFPHAGFPHSSKKVPMLAETSTAGGSHCRLQLQGAHTGGGSHCRRKLQGDFGEEEANWGLQCSVMYCRAVHFATLQCTSLQCCALYCSVVYYTAV